MIRTRNVRPGGGDDDVGINSGGGSDVAESRIHTDYEFDAAIDVGSKDPDRVFRNPVAGHYACRHASSGCESLDRGTPDSLYKIKPPPNNRWGLYLVLVPIQAVTLSSSELTFWALSKRVSVSIVEAVSIRGAR